ncbi:extracellular solute-binding protein [Methyloligella sp. 2.7D]|uniref:extracellular solute-binding protein n=1 Tax=unclassified Methyloligella TaxID=2625955 RepID=UPI00157DB3EF|nr:extracellular solute-binding protein [Methyloligella sp. GL2]QKP78387.1 extracellular solute-binding protein [Methyloligella sp. GL2]
MFASVLLTGLLAVTPLPAKAESPLSVVTWGGAYEQSQREAYFAPFTKETGIEVEVKSYDGSLKEIEAQIGEDPDVVDVSTAALKTLCEKELLDPIDKSILEPAQGGVALSAGQNAGDARAATPASSAAGDFLPGGLSKCGVASVAWSAAVVFNKDKLKPAPTKLSAFLDLNGFPGRRALPKTARYTLETALMADGVPPGRVYNVLATPQGQDRAFAALDKIKSYIAWWTRPSTPLSWVHDGKATMGLAYTGRIFRSAVEAPDLIGILWDGQIYDLDHWAIPEDAANKDEARKFIAFATAPKRLAAQAELTAYGPMRRSAIPLVGNHPMIGTDMRPFLPTAPAHFSNALQFDELWWEKHGAKLEARFEAWRKDASRKTDATADAGQRKKKKRKKKEDR